MMDRGIQAIVDQSLIADTHEHLLEESSRVKGSEHPKGIGALLGNYIEADLAVAGMPVEKWQEAAANNDDPERFWTIVRPWVDSVRNTGYWQAIRETIRELCGEEDLLDENYREIDHLLRSLLKPGYYRKILREICRIDHCQVNALGGEVFRETSMPDLLLQDIGTVVITSGFDIARVEDSLGREILTLEDCVEAVDRAFDLYGSRAVAVKNQAAYGRRIDYRAWTQEEAETSFRQCRENRWANPFEERKPLEDYLFLRSLERANEAGLPMKLHTGYYAGQGTMPLHRVRMNGGDMCELCLSHPKNRFVFMHITWPYQDEAIAVAKHFPNAYIDMCWSWTINPVAAVRFLKEFLVAAPANKLLTYGGDVSYIELVPGTVRLARRGIAQAVSELVEEGWISHHQVPALLHRLLRGNALDLFPVEDRRRSQERIANSTEKME